MSSKHIIAIVEGRVQGVWFRGSTQQQALTMGLSGYAKNLDDGNVEVIVTGDSTQVDALCQWLRQGPSGARVDTLTIDELLQLPSSVAPGQFQVL